MSKNEGLRCITCGKLLLGDQCFFCKRCALKRKHGIAGIGAALATATVAAGGVAIYKKVKE